ncbi:MAG: GNAT family N-acetyltransferase [Candidatus Dormibacterales bacterium]
MRLAALKDAPYAFGSTYEREIVAPQDNWRERLAKRAQFVARLDGEVAGTAGGYVSDEGITELISMWVSPGARGRGVGDALVDAVVAWAHEENKPALRLWVASGNDPAEHLYARHGFKPTGLVKPIHPGQERMEFEMMLRLNPPRMPGLSE